MKNVPQLRNRYHLMRHGESEANRAGVIVSKPENGIKTEFGLSEYGQEQVRRTALRSELSSRAIIYSSDFSRARQTAVMVGRLLGAEPPRMSAALRERDFGRWELTSADNYERVWRADRETWQARTWCPPRRIDAVETPVEVFYRTSRLISSFETQYADEDILLVSHGDTLQILQTGFAELPPHRHRDVEHMDTAEIRTIDL